MEWAPASQPSPSEAYLPLDSLRALLDAKSNHARIGFPGTPSPIQAPGRKRCVSAQCALEARNLGIFHMGVAQTLNLPHRLTQDVKMKVSTSTVVELNFDLQFNVVASSWLLA